MSELRGLCIYTMKLPGGFGMLSYAGFGVLPTLSNDRKTAARELHKISCAHFLSCP